MTDKTDKTDMTDKPGAPALASEVAAQSRRCHNCGAQLLGEHCYACGQPTKGLVRHFSSIIGDFLDSVFSFDTRTLRTLGPLLCKPGHLSNEYFHGHRVRYVSPVRLFFFLCIAAFFALRLTVDIDVSGNAEVNALSKADSVAAVEKLRDEALADLKTARAEVPDTPGAHVGMDIAIQKVQNEAAHRIAWLGERDAARARGEEVSAYRRSGTIVRTDETDGKVRVSSNDMQFNDKPWDPITNPIAIGWLPETGNVALNRLVGRTQVNLERIREQPRLLVDAFMGALPQTLFVLLPVFALLLKVAYVFKRRLYMEHLIVALHSHAFLCASILVLVGLGVLRDQTAGSGVVHAGLGWMEAIIGVWMPLYLLIMQKRVYRQGWPMTVLKFLALGTCYLVLLSLGAALNIAVSVVAM